MLCAATDKPDTVSDHDSRRRQLHRPRRAPHRGAAHPSGRVDRQGVGGPDGQQRLPGDLFPNRRDATHRRRQRRRDPARTHRAVRPEAVADRHQPPARDHWQALSAVAKATGAPTAAHQLDAGPLPVKPDRSWPTATPSRSASCPSTSSTCGATPPDRSRWRWTAPTTRRTCSPVTACSPAVFGKTWQERRSSSRSSATSPAGCSTSTPTPRWSTPGTVTTRRWVPSVPISKSGANDGGDRPGVTTALPGDLAVWDGHAAMVVGNGMMIEASNQ